MADLERIVGRLEGCVQSLENGQKALFDKVDDMHSIIREANDSHRKLCESRPVRAECQIKFDSLQDDRSRLKGALQFVLSAVALAGSIVAIVFKWKG